MSCPGTMRRIMENRLLMKIDQEEAMLEVLEELRQLDFIGNCWFDEDKVLHVVIRSRKTLEDPKKLREFWRLFFNNGVEDFDFT